MSSDWTGCESGSCVQYRTEGDTVTIRSTVTAEQMRLTVAKWDTFVAGLTSSLAAENARLRQQLATVRESLTDSACEVEWLRADLVEAKRERASALAAAEMMHNEVRDQRNAAIAEAAVLRHRDRRTQAVVEAAVAWVHFDRTAGGFERAAAGGRLVTAVDALQKGPETGLSATESAEQPPVEGWATGGARTQGGAQGAMTDEQGAEFMRTEDELDATYAKMRAHDRCQFCRGELPVWECELVQRTAEASVRTPRVWNAGDPEPEGVERVRDRNGVEWRRPAADGWDTAWRPQPGRKLAARRWPGLMLRAPLTEVLPEPAPAADNDHDPDGVVRFTASTAGWYQINQYLGNPLTAPRQTVVHLTDEQVAELHPDGEVPEAGRAGEAQERTEVGDAQVETQELRQREDPVPGSDRGKDRPRDVVTTAPQQGAGSGIPLPDLQGLAPDVAGLDRTEGLDAAIEAAAIELSRMQFGDFGWERLPDDHKDAWRRPAARIVRAASPLIERAALLAAADDWMVDWLAEGTGFPENTDAWMKRRATRVGGGQ